MNLFFKKSFKRISLVIFLAILPFKAFAIPQYSLLTGNKCLNCHVNNQGGGIRNELGWYTEQGNGFIGLDKVGLGSITELESNAYFDGLLTLGFDVRVQSARSHKSPDAERKLFPMQMAVYAAVKATDWATFEGSYNAGPVRYPGQQSYSASVLLQPDFSYPQLRAGFFQPSIGIRYDDHTMLVRQIAGGSGKSLIAPNYAELGAEITYDAIKWATFSFGAFSARSLAENTAQSESGEQISLIDDKNNPSLLGRIIFWPRLFENSINTYIGASVLNNGDFSLTNIFGGIGLTDNISVMGEYATSNKKDLQKTNNASVELSYQITSPLLAYIRAERGTTTVTATDEDVETYSDQYVIGAQIFPLPFIEFRPEYRILDNEIFKSSRYAVQLHVYY
ncbi:MAG: hypothetical protein V4642_08990 [Bacteroidota bacterium]